MDRERVAIDMLERLLRDLRTGSVLCTRFPSQRLHPVHEDFSPPGAKAEYEITFFIEARD